MPCGPAQPIWAWGGGGDSLEELQVSDPKEVGPYLLLGRLGAGGMGQVFLGRSPGGRLVAVKVVRADLSGDPEFRARFAREVAAARRVSGVFTAPVVDADPAASLPWLVTAFVNGLSLSQAVDDYGPLPVASVLALAAGLAEGLGAVHAAGVVHRDLKPSNVLLAPDGPRVIDFGISQAVDATHLTRTGMVIGSPAFMSPEQVKGGAVGPASDVFSLGAVLAFAATGHEPFGSGAPTAQLFRVVHGSPHLDQLPGDVRPLVERCLTKDPSQRPTARQFLAELTAAHPSAADLTDWLPASILQAAASPRPAATGHTPEPASRAAGQPGRPTAAPAGSSAEPSTAAASSPLTPGTALATTLTVAADHHQPGSAIPAEPQATDALRRAPTALQVGQRVNAVAFSPDGAQLATGGGGRVLIWNLQTGAVVRELRMARFDTVNAVAFSPDGARLATGSDKIARIWDAATWRQQLQVAHATALAAGPPSYHAVCAVAFSPDGARLATGSSDKTARIWDAATGRQRLQVAHRGKVRSVAFSPDGARLATGSDDKTARIWDIVGS